MARCAHAEPLQAKRYDTVCWVIRGDIALNGKGRDVAVVPHGITLVRKNAGEFETTVLVGGHDNGVYP